MFPTGRFARRWSGRISSAGLRRRELLLIVREVWSRSRMEKLRHRHITLDYALEVQSPYAFVRKGRPLYNDGDYVTVRTCDFVRNTVDHDVCSSRASRGTTYGTGACDSSRRRVGIHNSARLEHFNARGLRISQPPCHLLSTTIPVAAAFGRCTVEDKSSAVTLSSSRTVDRLRDAGCLCNEVLRRRISLLRRHNDPQYKRRRENHIYRLDRILLDCLIHRLANILSN